MSSSREKLVEEKKENSPEQFSENTLADLTTAFSNIKTAPGSYSMAVRIELIFSMHLLQQLCSHAQNPKENAREIITLIQERLKLKNTPAWNFSSYHSQINQAISLACNKLRLFYPDDLNLNEAEKFSQDCEKIAKNFRETGNKPEVTSQEKGNPEVNIYQFITDRVFKNQAIPNAWSLLERKMMEAGSQKDTWTILLSNVLPNIPTRPTFIKMLAHQVECADWGYFFERIKINNHFFRLMLGVDTKHLLAVHEARPESERTDSKFESDVYNSANNILRTQTKSTKHVFGFFPVTTSGPEGSVFQADLLAKHGCENQKEVLALAFSLLETYRRVRAYFPGYLGLGGKTGSAPDKEAKDLVCTVGMAFCLQAERFDKKELEQYIGTKLAAEKKQQYSSAMEGVLKVLFETLFDISSKVQAKTSLEKKM